MFFFILTNVKYKIKTLNNDYFFADLSTFGISKQSNRRLILHLVMLVMQEIKLGHFSQSTNSLSHLLLVQQEIDGAVRPDFTFAFASCRVESDQTLTHNVPAV